MAGMYRGFLMFSAASKCRTKVRGMAHPIQVKGGFHSPIKILPIHTFGAWGRKRRAKIMLYYNHATILANVCSSISSQWRLMWYNYDLRRTLTPVCIISKVMITFTMELQEEPYTVKIHSLQ